MAVSLQTITQYLEKLAPLQHAQSWDKVGLQIGDKEVQINCLLVVLEVSEPVVKQAIDVGAELIIAHHPLLFTPLNSLVWHDPHTRLLRRLIQANTNLYVAHTNLDASPAGSSNFLADLLALKERKPLAPVKGKKLYKLVVFVPQDQAQDLRQALGQAGAGVIGDYSYCSFQAEGTGFFQAGQKSKPFVGKAGKYCSTPEIRLETLVSEEVLTPVITALHRVHPYQEPAYDLYPLHSLRAQSGLGIIGCLPKPMKLGDLAEQLHKRLKLRGLRWVGNGQQVIERVAVCGGSGGDLVMAAQSAGAQLLISGDFKYHQARQAQMWAIALLDVGHFSSEYLAMQSLADRLKAWLQEQDPAIKVFTSREEASPFCYYQYKEEQ